MTRAIARAWKQAQIEARKNFGPVERAARAWFSDGFFAGAFYMIDELSRPAKKRRRRK